MKRRRMGSGPADGAGLTPSAGVLRTARQLFEGDGGRQEAFLRALAVPQPYRPAVLWMGERLPDAFACEARPDWLPECVDWAAEGERPGQHPAHEAGAFYCLDMSSVFAATVLTAVPKGPQVVIDLCAAPGGKSLCAWRLLEPRFLLANETIRKRTGSLISNFARCGVGVAAEKDRSATPADSAIDRAAVVSMDTGPLAERAPHGADLVIVDAPCSGQSLVVKGEAASGAFHPATVNMNTNRQRRILANAAGMVAGGGHLAYLTCTYAPKENEGNVAWFLKHFPQFAAVTVPRLEAHRSHLDDRPCYRLWPQDGIGAGSFAVLFQNTAETPRQPLPVDDLWPLWPAWRRRDGRAASTL